MVHPSAQIGVSPSGHPIVEKVVKSGMTDWGLMSVMPSPWALGRGIR